MYSVAAPKYWSLYCHVGGTSDSSTGKTYGIGCRVGPGLILTAAHVYKQHKSPAVLLGGGVWKCSVVKEWSNLDIALLKADVLLKKMDEIEEPTDFPRLADKTPTMGTSIGYIGSLKLMNESGQKDGRTYFGQGHVAFFEKGLRGQNLVAIDGGAIEQGFSGGPAFTSDGVLCGVIVEALHFAPNPGSSAPRINPFPLVSPIAPINLELLTLLKEA
ncbi:MAG: trypsin-like peptidase domain-containing protein [Acidobacteria bacterium]|nr:trypsin-like peptidase domain-containing protein [Acidobacteriota bacterium]MBI3487514.1 trypsin-like peptidase domain-containing protein [Acidobacteriota bacterium]